MGILTLGLFAALIAAVVIARARRSRVRWSEDVPVVSGYAIAELLRRLDRRASAHPHPSASARSAG